MSTGPFAGTAQYYSKYRLGYPDGLITLIVDAFGLDGRGRLLDVGCGTGKLTIPLSRHFEHTVAVDPDQEMLSELDRQAQLRGKAGSLEVRRARAEDCSPEGLGHFRLISSGDAFHWMDRDLVLRLWHRMLFTGRHDGLHDGDAGGLAIVGTGGGSMRALAGWQQAVWDVIHRWLGPRRRNAEWQEDTRRHEDVIEASGLFTITALGGMAVTYERDVDSIIGFLYSTSFCNKTLLGANVPRFEDDLRRTLLQLEPGGRFTEDVTAGYIFARPLALSAGSTRVPPIRGEL